MPFCRPIESCRSVCDTVPIFEVRLNSLVAVDVTFPIVQVGSKTDRVNLCEVGGVSLRLNIAEISWRLISRCYQHRKLSRDHITRYPWQLNRW